MRWDNPLTPDWFQFPDLASFPDYQNEDRNNDEYDLSIINKAIKENNYAAFMNEVNRFTDISAPWVSKLSQTFKSYRRQGNSKQEITNKCFQGLYQEGIYLTDIDFTGLVSADNVGDLVSKPDWNPNPGSYDRGVYLSENQKAVIQNKFSDAGILKGASAYANQELNVAAVFLHVSMPTDKHYKQFFMDATTTPRWTNLHIDPKEYVVKAIVYLNNINEYNGGFGYVPQSNRYIYPAYQEIFGRAITTGNYCKTPQERKSVFSLPAPLRVSYNFGRCVLDNTALASELDKRFMRVTSDIANVAVFDAGAGMHQGGIVQEGLRVSLQVLMK